MRRQTNTLHTCKLTSHKRRNVKADEHTSTGLTSQEKTDFTRVDKSEDPNVWTVTHRKIHTCHKCKLTRSPRKRNVVVFKTAHFQQAAGKVDTLPTSAGSWIPNVPQEVNSKNTFQKRTRNKQPDKICCRSFQTFRKALRRAWRFLVSTTRQARVEDIRNSTYWQLIRTATLSSSALMWTTRQARVEDVRNSTYWQLQTTTTLSSSALMWTLCTRVGEVRNPTYRQLTSKKNVVQFCVDVNNTLHTRVQDVWHSTRIFTIISFRTKMIQRCPDLRWFEQHFAQKWKTFEILQ